VPINVAVEEPRTRVVGLETDRDIIVRVTDADDVAHDGVVEVVRRVSRAADDVEDMSMQVERVLIKNTAARQSEILARTSWIGSSQVRQC
jgi:hypothetical protein